MTREVLYSCPSEPRSGTDPACSHTPASLAAFAIASYVGPSSGSACEPNSSKAKAPVVHSSGSTTRSAPA